MTDATRPDLDAIRQLHRYTITGEGASLGYFRLVEDRSGAWVAWPELEAHVTALTAEKQAWVDYAYGGVTEKPEDWAPGLPTLIETAQKMITELESKLALCEQARDENDRAALQATAPPTFNAHTLTLEFRRFLSEPEWRAVVDAARQVPYVQGLCANAVVQAEALCEQARDKDRVFITNQGEALSKELDHAEMAEAQVRHLTQQLQAYEAYCRPVDLDAARRALAGVSLNVEKVP